MQRTTIMLPEGLKAAAAQLARQAGVSLGELIRDSLQQNLLSAKKVSNKDPFFQDHVFFEAPIPENLSIKHDDYLYGEKD